MTGAARIVRGGLGAGLAAVERRVQRARGRPFVHVLHIRKTGGTAVNEAVAGYLRAGTYAIELHEHDFALRDVPRGDAVVFFVRDPLARFVSGFYSRQRRGQPRYYNEWTPAEAAAFASFETPDELGRALTSTDPALRSRAESAMRGIRHVNSSYWDWFEDEAYARSRATDVLFVGRQEQLDTDFARLAQMLGLPHGVALPRDDIRAHRTPGELDRRLSDEATANLRVWYARDYEFMTLCEELWLGVASA